MSDGTSTIEYTEHRDADGLIHREEVDPDTTPKDSYIRTKQVEPLKPLAAAVQIKGRPMLNVIAERIAKEAPAAPDRLPARDWEHTCPLNQCNGSGWIFMEQTPEHRSGVRPCGCRPAPPPTRQNSRPRNETEHRAAKAIFGDWEE